MSEQDSKTFTADSEQKHSSSRRTVLKVGIGVMGAGLAGGVGVPALSYLWFPVGQAETSSGAELSLVGRRDQFGSEPKKVDIFQDKVDAWNRVKHVKVGSVWVMEKEGKLMALSTRCPHLGCAIDWDLGSSQFICPCHDSAFSPEGTRIHGPSPRSMDHLEIAEQDELVQIRYLRFRQGVKGKEEV